MLCEFQLKKKKGTVFFKGFINYMEGKKSFEAVAYNTAQ